LLATALDTICKALTNSLLAQVIFILLGLFLFFNITRSIFK